MTQIKATLRYLQLTPRKVRLVADLVRGMDAQEARAQLDNLPKRSGVPLKKLLLSCIANAKHNFRLDEQDLYIAALRVDEGPMLKRLFPRARGRADMKKKRMSHITLVLSSKETPNKQQTARNKKKKL